MTSLHPAAAGIDFIAEIAWHSAGLAEAAEGNLDAPVEHCPGWSVADLVWHLREVHWFWGTIAANRLQQPPGDGRPARPADADLIAVFRAGAQLMVTTLQSADPDERVWTWAPQQQNIGFITRHQVQEAAVHRWDAEHAAGRTFEFDPAVAVDSVEEFLTFSVASVDDAPDEARQGLEGAFVLRATDCSADWTVRDGPLAATLQFERGVVGDPPSVTGTASDLLLWLYRRGELPITGTVGTDLIDRFRQLTSTD